jgi:acetyl esterase
MQACTNALLTELDSYDERIWAEPAPMSVGVNARNFGELIMASGPYWDTPRSGTPPSISTGYRPTQPPPDVAVDSKENYPDMRIQIIDEPGFAAETDALLRRFGPSTGVADYETLLAERAEPPEPDLSGHLDPTVHTADLHLPLSGGPTLVRLYAAASAAGRQPLLLWLHGGGFVGGSVIDLDFVCSRLAALAGVKVVSLEYRLAPEHPFPAALHDTYDAMSWLAAYGALIGGDGRLAAGGQSAGAALVAGACLRARDHGGPALVRQVLCYPVLDFNQDTESYRLFDGVFHSIAPGSQADTWYLAGQPVTMYAAPLRAASLARLPPALVIGAGRDPLRDDARRYAARLHADGVSVTCLEYADTMHAFLNFCPQLSAGPHAIGAIAADLVHALSGLRADPLP